MMLGWKEAARVRSGLAAVALFSLLSAASQPATQDSYKPEAIVTENVPPIPPHLADEIRPYLSSYSVLLATWHPSEHAMLVSTTISGRPQLHRVASPLGMRRQVTFEDGPVRLASYSPADGLLIVSKDRGGDEQFEIYAVADGRFTKVTKGGRNLFGSWSNDGRLVGYSSTRRDGRNFDLYVVDPRRPDSDHMVMRGEGVWAFVGFFPGDQAALVAQGGSLFELRLADGSLRPLAPAGGGRPALVGAGVDANGRIWALSPSPAGFLSLGSVDRQTGSFVGATRERWGIENYAVSADGRFVAYSVNEAGFSRLRVRDVATGRTRTATALPEGMITGLSIARWGEIAVTFTSAHFPLSTYGVNSRTLAVTPWVVGETGGIDANRFPDPELVTIRSFDGTEMSGLLYRPDPARFPGKRPMIFDIHGGPDSQARPIYQYGKNYLLDRLGIALFYPNVRGSTGYGDAFAAMDNGPSLRENSIRDIGAFLDHFSQDSRLDMTKVGVTGGSYGGYMCYSALIYYPDRLNAGICEVAPASLVSTLENMAEYRRDARRLEYGDERDPAQRQRMLELSPLTRAREIRAPLMVVSGANDPRVPASEATQMLAAVRAADRPAWHILARNEGHGFFRKENENYRVLATSLFWRQFLLGETVSPE